MSLKGTNRIICVHIRKRRRDVWPTPELPVFVGKDNLKWCTSQIRLCGLSTGNTPGHCGSSRVNVFAGENWREVDGG